MVSKKESMKATHHTRNFIIAAFLLSLLFHASSIIYVVWQGPNNHTPQSLQEKEEALKKEIQKRQEWAETKARASNFGTPVMFEDDLIDPLAQASEDLTMDTTEDETKDTEKNKQIVPEQKIIEEKSVSIQESSSHNRSENKSENKQPTRKKSVHKKLLKQLINQWRLNHHYHSPN